MAYKTVKMIDHPCGKRFKYENLILMAKVSSDGGKTCTGCWFASKTDGKNNYTKSCYKHGLACTPANRKDKKQVIFVEV